MGVSVESLLNTNQSSMYRVAITPPIKTTISEDVLYEMATKHNIGFIFRGSIIQAFIIYKVLDSKKIYNALKVLEKFLGVKTRFVRFVSFNEFLEELKNKKIGGILPKETIT